uniref:Serine endopeptidase degp2 n=1 Tax=Rhizophora mucronata TaxID=61149 RepID=A0A2P2JH49_RHIMU
MSAMDSQVVVLRLKASIILDQCCKTCTPLLATMSKSKFHSARSVFIC